MAHTAKVVLRALQVVCALVVLGCSSYVVHLANGGDTTAADYPGRRLLASSPPSDGLAGQPDMTQELQSLESKLYYVVAAGAGGTLASIILLVVTVKANLAPVTPGSHLKECVASAIWVVLFIASGAAIASGGKCPAELGKPCAIVNSAQAFSWLGAVLWCASAVLSFLAFNGAKNSAGIAPNTVTVLPVANRPIIGGK